jgi:transcriptional repressor NrdR
MAILGPLRELDEVAYLRFASVYRAFESADDFETEIAMLRAERPAGAPDETEAMPGQRAARASPQATRKTYQKT